MFPELNWEVALQPRHIMGSVAPAYLPSPTPAERPHVPKVALLATILGGFVAGAAAGALVVVALHQLSLLIPAAGLAAMGVYALTGARDLVADGARR